MRADDFRRRVQPLLPQDGHWSFRRQLAYEVPVGAVLCGVLSEGSDTGGTYVWRVTMPLFKGVGSEISLSQSHRTGGGLILPGDDEGFAVAARQALEPFGSERQLLQRMASAALTKPNASLIGFALVLLGETRRARKALEIASLPTPEDPRPFVLADQDRARSVLRLIESDGAAAAQGQLNEWIEATRNKLGLSPALR